jgi:hypothetical protein
LAPGRVPILQGSFVRKTDKNYFFGHLTLGRVTKVAISDGQNLSSLMPNFSQIRSFKMEKGRDFLMNFERISGKYHCGKILFFFFLDKENLVGYYAEKIIFMRILVTKRPNSQEAKWLLGIL